ncbi:MAG: LysM peptidoglycan-binding domain-containing protein [Caldilineaceae bacterium]|nr:LysM peptidoglycan-binding domain-containing protein [Caldilineaceae bacterium]
MNRRQLLFVVLLNSLVSLVIAIVVVWVAEIRRPDLEELAVRYTPPPVVMIATSTAETVPLQPEVQQTPLPAENPAPTPTPQPQTGEPEIYVVQPGDSLFGIALRYNVTVQQLMDANNLTNPDFLFSGQRLEIPVAGTVPNSANAASTSPTPSSGLTMRVAQPGNLSDEHVLIVNESNSAVNLQGWTLGKVNGPVYALSDLPLFPGGSVRIHTESGQDDSLNLYWSLSNPVWESGAVARLFNQDGREVVSYTVP